MSTYAHRPWQGMDMSRLLLKQYESRIKDLMELGNTREDAVNIAARTAATGAGAASDNGRGGHGCRCRVCEEDTARPA